MSDTLDYPFNDIYLELILEDYPEIDIFCCGYLHIPRLEVYNKASGRIEFEDVKEPESLYRLDISKKRYFINCPAVTPGRFGYDKPVACLLKWVSSDELQLMFLFVTTS